MPSVVLKPKPGASYMYEKAIRVLDVEVDQYGQNMYVLFHLWMPASFNLVGLDAERVIVAVPIADCEEA